MNISEFYGWAIPQLVEAGITVKLLNKASSLHCSGWFDSHRKELVSCTKGPEAFGVLIHEFCHFLQFKNDPEIWKKCDDGTANFFLWLKGKEFSKREVTKFTKLAQELEHDCETKAVALIKELGIDIDLARYIQKANAYLYSYLVTKELRCWPNTTKSIYSDEASKHFNTTLDTIAQVSNKKNIPKKSREQWLATCYRLDVASKKN